MKRMAFPSQRSIKRMFLLFSVIYSCILLIFGCIACYFSYEQRKESLLSDFESTLDHLKQNYDQTTENFWQIYMPLFTEKDTAYRALGNFFSESGYEHMTPLERKELVDALHSMMVRDSAVQWMALFSDHPGKGYILYSNNNVLQELTSDFPYWSRVQSKKSQMEIYGSEPPKKDHSLPPAFAICGGVPQGMEDGKILVGYSTSPLQQVADSLSSPISNLSDVSFGILSGEELLFSSGSALSREDIFALPRDTFSGAHTLLSGKHVFLRTISGTSHSYLVYCTIPWKALFRYSHQNTPLILGILCIFMLLAIGFNFSTVRTISLRVNQIQRGLNVISDNHLEFRFPATGYPDEFSQISDAINSMTTNLQENIARAYYYELKQREAKLSDLQSKFNPHFLYNTLEMLRTRIYQNGDAETAELVTALASIFRGIISSKSFVSIGEELSFSKRYLSLLRARYGVGAHIRYDIDTEVLRYGIIRNVLQPLIENYFIHGFDPAEEENYLLFQGKCQADDTILLTVQDNGLGMPQKEIDALNESLNEPIRMENESYGLKNIHQRIHLFYGDPCGLAVSSNGEKGLRVTLRIRKITCEEQTSRQME